MPGPLPGPAVTDLSHPALTFARGPGRHLAIEAIGLPDAPPIVTGGPAYGLSVADLGWVDGGRRRDRA